MLDEPIPGHSRLISTDGTLAGSFELPQHGATGIEAVLARPGTGNSEFLYVTTPTSGLLREVYLTDGTLSGTRRVLDVHGEPVELGSDIVDPDSYSALPDFLVYRASPGQAPYELRSLSLAGGEGPRSLGLAHLLFLGFHPLRVGDRLVFPWRELQGSFLSSSPQELYVTDGTPEGSGLLLEIFPGVPGSVPSMGASDGQTAYFSAIAPTTGRELWRTDGTPSGTYLVADVAPGPAFGVGKGTLSKAPFGALLGDRFVFRGLPPGLDSTVFVSDGTEAGTAPLAPQGQPFSSPEHFTFIGDRVAFTAVIPGLGREPFITDGDASFSLGDIAAGRASSQARGFADLGGATVFRASAPSTGGELWAGASPASGPSLLTDFTEPALQDPTAGSFPSPLVRAIDLGFFVADVLNPDAPSSPFWTLSTLFVTTGGPNDVREVLRSEQPLGVIAALDRKVLFARAAESFGEELWISDGTPTGTRVLGTGLNFATEVLEEGLGVSIAEQVGELVYFASGQLGDQTQLWRTDGTPEGTLQLSNFSYLSSLVPPQFVKGYRIENLGPTVFFAVGTYGSFTTPRELWISEGTPETTRPFAPEVFGRRLLRDYVRAGDRIWAVYARSGDFGEVFELWSTDGTAAGTRFEGELGTASVGYQAYLTSIGERLLWLGSEGENSTLKVAGPGSPPQTLLTLKGSFSFLPNSGPEQEALCLVLDDADPELAGVWITDGTPAGTRRIADEPVYTPGLLVTPLGSGASAVITGAAEALESIPIYVSGTAPGSVELLSKLTGQADSDRVVYLGRVGNRLLVENYEPELGLEPHTLPLEATDAFIVEAFGGPCSASNWPELDLEGRLRPGQDLTLELTRAQPGAPAFLFGSLQAAQVEILGCTVYLQDPRLLGTLALDGAGTARLPLSVPADPRLAGTQIFLQAAVWTASLQITRPLELSQGLELIVGP